MGGWVWWVGWLAPKISVFSWHFDNGASIKIDYVLAEDGGLLHILPLTIHLHFFDRQVGGAIKKLSYS